VRHDPRKNAKPLTSNYHDLQGYPCAEYR